MRTVCNAEAEAGVLYHRQRRVYCIIASNSSPCPIVQGSVVFVNVMSCLFC